MRKGWWLLLAGVGVGAVALVSAVVKSAAGGGLSVSASGFQVTVGTAYCGTGGLGNIETASVDVAVLDGTGPYAVTITLDFSDGTHGSYAGVVGINSINYCDEKVYVSYTAIGGSVTVRDSAGNTGSATF